MVIVAVDGGAESKRVITEHGNDKVKSLYRTKKFRARDQDMSWADFHAKLPLQGHAIINSMMNLKYEIKLRLTKRDGKSDVQIVPEYLTGNPYSLHFARMNRFNAAINRRMMQWFEAGLFMIHGEWGLHYVKPEYLEAEVDEETSGQPLTLDLFRLLFGFYALGICCSVPIFLIERYCYD